MPAFDLNRDYSNYNILAVDDIPLNLLLVQKMLSRFKFEIRTAANGQQALDAVASRKPDLILLDLMMPGIDGFEVIKRLRADSATADIRIVILSALNSNEDVVKGFDLGANDFIMKPIIMEKLLNSVFTQLEFVPKG
ncbi:MAG: response regulator [Bacteroidales bacterium]|nr:response regulator [Bacteroidales bacterium]MDY6418001.1 response regulator [Bacteroidales bacterium]MDY6444102.1 response regulator [Bacteroidales bacterium]